MKVFSGIVSAIGTVCLAFILFTAGYFACAAPITTEVFSQNTSNFEASPYALDDLNALAVASRNYTVDARAAGTTAEEAQAAFNTVLMNAATHSAQHYTNATKASADETTLAKRQAWADLLQSLGETTPNNAFGKEDVNAVAAQMAKVGDSFALDEDAFSHLDDCNTLINGIVPYVRYLGIAAALCFVLLLVTRQWKGLGRMLSIAPFALILCFAFMGTWAIIDFHGFFTAFHGVFFPQGNWTFSSESLLICMYPTAFWMAMGALWLATTALASIIVLAIGRKFAHIGE